MEFKKVYMENKELSDEFRAALEKWADENLNAMGIFKDKIADYEKWQEKAIKQLMVSYSYKAIEMFLLPKNRGMIDSPDCSAKISGRDGHSMEIFIKAENGIITDLSFQTDGCKGYIASGGMLVELVKGQSIDKSKILTAQNIIDALGGLPKENVHCALLAVNVLKEALKKTEERAKSGQ